MGQEDCISYMAVGTEELADRVSARAGDRIFCLKHVSHALLPSLVEREGRMEPTEFLLLYHCDDKTYVAAMRNKLFPGLRLV